MSHPPTVQVEQRGAAGVITLSRAERRNALDERLIVELTGAIRTVEADSRARVLLLCGAGEDFCAGADLEWMARGAALGPEEGMADAQPLAALLAALDRCGKPTVARVQGHALGGGVGLVAACDVVVAAEGASFGLTEVRLGLVPAVIGPYVVGAIGERAARRWMLTGERFSAAEARRAGLVSEVAEGGALDAAVARLVDALAAGGPAAQREAKALLRALRGRPVDEALTHETARTLARVRATPEAQEGIAAFLGKRRPRWREE